MTTKSVALFLPLLFSSSVLLGDHRLEGFLMLSIQQTGKAIGPLAELAFKPDGRSPCLLNLLVDQHDEHICEWPPAGTLGNTPMSLDPAPLTVEGPIAFLDHMAEAVAAH
ncbi:MAG: hypothetical protein WCO00_17905 [Rhodospirillaceae bacterium]